MQDEVVKLSPHARAIRDVEDEELRSFFYGMSPWQVKDVSMNLFYLCTIQFKMNKLNESLAFHAFVQFMLIVAASSVGEELFYRAAVQVCFIDHPNFMNTCNNIRPVFTLLISPVGIIVYVEIGQRD